MTLRTHTISIIAIASMALSSHAFASPLHNQSHTLNYPKLQAVTSADGLSPAALKTALSAYNWARLHHKLGRNKSILTVVNFNLPSYERRLWVVNLYSDKVLLKLYTTQGKNSGLVYARHFSNKINTDESSLGLYVTSNEYYGHHGRSMRLNGLDKGVNSNARRRSIVIHSAWYATPAFIKHYHRAGRSWGCFAIAPKAKVHLLNDIKGGSAFFAYA